MRGSGPPGGGARPLLTAQAEGPVLMSSLCGGGVDRRGFLAWWA
ncbi:hypothetical protein HMPREF1979_02871 [Actinomyces johnsonii F0542]|uniref:Uncharacterized protein n=1 Tax=Actinomyces johnsonii F0542 TaxID=1321818 RepID=U1QIX1_9ACTO|nr:hypothetical protein HMPREF1979_02871 [Actinomyces johnsonii F0542]